MAISPIVQYPTQVAPVTSGYPYGGAQNITTPGDNTGTPWEAALLNDIFGQQQALLRAAGIVPSGSPDQVGTSQYLQAIQLLAAGGAEIHSAAGTNAIVLTPITDRQFAPALYEGQRVTWKQPTTNTSTMSLSYNGVVKNLVSRNNLGILAGQLVAGL